MELKNGIFKLNGIVQHYSWGGFEFIPKFLGLTNENLKPYAEYWLGAHPNFPSEIVNGSTVNLNHLIASEPLATLGEQAANKFHSLPYLFKILDVRQMLSIQVHPDKRSAIIEYEEENKKGIPLNASNRNYKDRNHKPELMVALSDFWLLHGFKKRQNLLQVLNSVPELHFLIDLFQSGGYKGLYEYVMSIDQKEVQSILNPLLQRIIPLYQQNSLSKENEDFWAARAALTFCKDTKIDRGIFSIYFFNLIHLKKGEGVYQPEGMPHAYLEGQNVEVMANSDNVLRAGLTEKHIDTKELMKHVNFTETQPGILNPDQNTNHIVFSSPAEEFELHQYQMNEKNVLEVTSRTGEIWLMYEGAASLKNKHTSMSLNKGEAVFLLPGQIVEVKNNYHCVLFRVTVPDLPKN